MSPMSYDLDTMMTRAQITLDAELYRGARARANEMGVSFAEYIRRLIARDFAQKPAAADVSAVFDLGRSAASHAVAGKDAMIGGAIAAE